MPDLPRAPTDFHRLSKRVSSTFSTPYSDDNTKFSAKWRSATQPMSRSQRSPVVKASTPEQHTRAASDAARANWKRVGEIARRAGGDDPEEATENEEETTPEQREEGRQKKAQQRADREKTAKMMDLQYFLEMVDQKHRYVRQ
jgi:hypothetical protein